MARKRYSTEQIIHQPREAETSTCHQRSEAHTIAPLSRPDSTPETRSQDCPRPQRPVPRRADLLGQCSGLSLPTRPTQPASPSRHRGFRLEALGPR